MAIASGMKELAQEITASHQNRVKKLGDLSAEARQILKEADELVRGFGTSRKKAGIQLRKDLACDKSQRESDVTGIIQGFKSSRGEMGSALRKDLKLNTAAIKSEVGGLRETAQKTMRGFRNDRIEMGNNLRTGLAGATAERRAEVKKMRGGFQKNQAVIRADLNEAADTWHKLASSGMAIETKPAPGMHHDESPGVEEKLLAAVKAHPQGITLTEIADSLGIAAITLARVSRRLTEKGQIRKDNKTYFPADLNRE